MPNISFLVSLSNVSLFICENSAIFHILALCPKTVLTAFLAFKIFHVYHIICKHTHILNYKFQILMLFIFSPDATFSTTLNNNGESEHPWLVPVLKSFQLFSIQNDIVNYNPNNFDVFLFFSNFAKGFYHEMLSNLIKWFLCIYWD